MDGYYLICMSNSSGLWPVHPGHGATEERRSSRSAHRSRVGGLHAYAWGAHYGATVPLTFVESGFQGVLGEWWRTQSRLAWVRFGATGPVTVLVRIGNLERPLGRRHAPEGARFAGTLRLEGIGRDGDRIRGAPLILDHATLGTLDAHNALL
jgi:hypothetical protein